MKIDRDHENNWIKVDRVKLKNTSQHVSWSQFSTLCNIPKNIQKTWKFSWNDVNFFCACVNLAFLATAPVFPEEFGTRRTVKVHISAHDFDVCLQVFLSVIWIFEIIRQVASCGWIVLNDHWRNLCLGDRLVVYLCCGVWLRLLECGECFFRFDAHGLKKFLGKCFFFCSFSI